MDVGKSFAAVSRMGTNRCLHGGQGKYTPAGPSRVLVPGHQSIAATPPIIANGMFRSTIDAGHRAPKTAPSNARIAASAGRTPGRRPDHRMAEFRLRDLRYRRDIDNTVRASTAAAHDLRTGRRH